MKNYIVLILLRNKSHKVCDTEPFGCTNPVASAASNHPAPSTSDERRGALPPSSADAMNPIIIMLFFANQYVPANSSCDMVMPVSSNTSRHAASSQSHQAVYSRSRDCGIVMRCIAAQAIAPHCAHYARALSRMKRTYRTMDESTARTMAHPCRRLSRGSSIPLRTPDSSGIASPVILIAFD